MGHQTRREPCRLMATIAMAEGARERLAAAVQAVALAAVVVRLPPDAAGRWTEARQLTQWLQARDVAVLADGDAALARAIGADGLHLVVSPDGAEQSLRAARAELGPSANLGCDAGASRHAAMTAGEAGADYVAFSLALRDGPREDAARRRHDLVAWWAELFEVPVVALDVATTEAARELAAAGADFVAVDIEAGRSPAEIFAHFRSIRAAIDAEVPA